MKLNTKIIAGLLATTALAFGVAHAQMPGGGPGGMGCDVDGPKGRAGKMMGDPAARVEQRLTQMKSQLKITPQQEPLWQAYAEKMKAEAGAGMKAMRDKAQDQAATAPERMAQMMTMMRERMTAMESMSDTFKRLYDSMSAEQKAIADKAGPFGGQGPMAGRPGRPGGQGPQGPQGKGEPPRG